MRDFNRSFNRMRRFVMIFIGAVFVIIIGWWVLVGVVGVSIAKNPEKVSEKVGKAAKSFKDGFNKGFHDGDTTYSWDEAAEKYEVRTMDESDTVDIETLIKE